MFLQSTTVLQHPKDADAIGAALAELFQDETPDFVVGPAVGGVVLAYTVARALSCRALFAEKDTHGGMFVREAFSVAPGERFIAVEDVVTTGGSLKKAVVAAENEGGVCVGLGSIIDRGESSLEGLRALARLEFPTYPPDACPLCDEGVPLERV